MALLIVREASNGHEIGRRGMDPHERYELYHLCAARTLFPWAQGRFHIHTVAWRVPAEECVLGVTFDSWAPVERVEPC